MIATVILHKTGQRMSAELKEIENRCVVEFRPPKKFDWSYGFDWFREGREGDGGIDFNKICTAASAMGNDEYNAGDIDFSQWKKPTKDKTKRYDSWLALYPPNQENYGSTEATLRLLAFSDKDYDATLRVDFDSDYFQVSPTEFALPKSVNNKKGTFLESPLTIKCIKAFGKEQRIRIVSEGDEEVGCLRVVPNDDNHRYKLKVRLVKVLLFANDKSALDKAIRVDKITPLLNESCLSHCFLRPIVEPVVQELDLTDRSDEWRSYMRDITQSTLGRKEKVIDEKLYLDTVFREIINAFHTKFEDVEYDSSYNIVFFFINHKIGYDDVSTGEWGNTKGYTKMKERLSLIMQNGVDTHTLSHEALHARGLDHTFEDERNISKYHLTKHLTDNIMDYAPQGEESKEKYMQSTYKWQWYAVKDYADDTNIYRGLKKESE